MLGKSHRPLAAVTVAVAVLVPAGIAQAATKNVSYGLGGGKPPAGTPETAGFYDFFPRSVKIRAGDRLRYTINGFGVVYSGPKDRIEGLVQLDAATPVAGASDATGRFFWFNGQGTPKVNPFYLARAGDGKVDKGQKGVDHNGLSLGRAKPYTLTFPKPGTYRVYDALHPDVFQKVTVVKKRAKVPGAGADRARAAKQTAKLVKEARKLADVTAPGNTILVGNDSKHVGFFQYFPPAATVKAGQPVTITAGERVNDVHNLAIGPEAFMKGLSETLFGPGPSGVVLNPAAVYPSQAPNAGGLTFGGTEQGGFVNTGFMDTDPRSPLPGTATITFTTPGTYRYVCNIHSDGVNGMTGTITVQ